MQDFINDIYAWLNSGQYGFFTSAAAYMVKQAVLGYLAFLKEVIPFAWGVAKEIMNDLNISAYLDQAWGSLDGTTKSILGFLKIPEGVNFILSAAATRFVLRFVPGF